MIRILYLIVQCVFMLVIFYPSVYFVYGVGRLIDVVEAMCHSYLDVIERANHYLGDRK